MINNSQIITELSKSGAPTLSVINGEKKQYIHSSVNPANENRIFLKQLKENQADLIIVMGFGLGYHLEGCKEYLKGKKLLIIDNPIVSENTESKEASEKIISSSITYMSESDDLIQETLREYLNENDYSVLSVLRHTASYRIFNDYFRFLERLILKIVDQRVSNRATINRFADLMLKNCIKKIINNDGFYAVSSLYNMFNDLNVFIVSSSPTAFSSLEIIKKHSSDWFIISVDSALPMLCDYGIKPDMVVSIDPQSHIEEHLAGYDLSTMIVVEVLTSYPVSKINSSSKRFLSFNTHPVCQLIQEVLKEDVGSIDSKTGNIAGDVIELAVKLGFRNIVVSGIDFSFPYYTIYARGSSYQNRYAYIYSNRLKTMESLNSNYIFNSSHGLKVEGVFTRKNLQTYRSSVKEHFLNKNNVYQLGNINRIFVKAEDNLFKNENRSIDKNILIKKILNDCKQFDFKKDRILDILKENKIWEKITKASYSKTRVAQKLLTIINNL